MGDGVGRGGETGSSIDNIYCDSVLRGRNGTNSPKCICCKSTSRVERVRIQYRQGNLEGNVEFFFSIQREAAKGKEGGMMASCGHFQCQEEEERERSMW